MSDYRGSALFSFRGEMSRITSFYFFLSVDDPFLKGLWGLNVILLLVDWLVVVTIEGVKPMVISSI